LKTVSIGKIKLLGLGFESCLCKKLPGPYKEAKTKMINAAYNKKYSFMPV